ncbi:fungal-specific transcription factor domain-containing protein [Cadophora sp. MPI-SDFR-AT-0126]|nr:fungal-specific transcription factor domain-containing protein [Leotiomycetes sp. MPI-SDFR-AT-0126]
MEESTSISAGKRNAVARRKAICSSCRKRKSKCDSRLPSCSTCLAHNSKCHYDKPPSLAYTRSLEARIEQLLLERSGNSPYEQINVTGKDIVLANVTQRSPLAPTSPYQSTSADDANNLSSPTCQSQDETQERDKGDSDRWVSQISVDSHGGVSFHNPTSVFHEAPSPESRIDTLAQVASGVSLLSPRVQGDHNHQVEQIKHSLVSYAAHQRHLEDLALENITAIQIDVPADVAAEFLRFHWCWIHPMFMFVYRPAFTRDMALSSPNQPETPYFSEPLLKVLLAHSARFRIKDSGDGEAANAVMVALQQHAQHSLAMRLTSPSSISTVQALLQQSARDFAFGKSSQAWLYSGMAFRIAIDLGIHLPSDKLRGYVRSLTAEDIEIRKRLFWSCYTWDKAMSLYLGRMPAFTPPVESNPPDFMDDFTEQNLWEPFYGSEQTQGGIPRPAYPPQKGHTISCFTGLCKLSIILSTIMLEIYGTSSTDTPTNSTLPNPKNSSFIKISTSIQKWWAELPFPVRLDVQNLPPISPPLHIVSLNLLYQTALILLHRPYIIGTHTSFSNPAVQRSYQICVTATAAIHDLLVLLTSTFGYEHTTYLNCYNTYVAATIAVLHFQLREEENVALPDTGVDAEKLGLKFFLEVLQRSAMAMPGLKRSVEIVKRHMQNILEMRSRRYMESLFPASDRSSNTRTEPLQQQRQHTQNPQRPSAISTNLSSLTQDAISTTSQYPNFPMAIHNSHSDRSANSEAYPTFNLDGLPAFPGQDYNMGIDCNLDEEMIDPQMRATFSGLDPHLTLNHESSDWTYGGFMGATT